MINGKNIVITGANSGIGLETLKLLAQGDNKILAVDLRIDRIEALALKNVFPMICDVSTKENVDSIFAAATEKLGSIDIFFANAGFPYYETMDYVNWNRVEDIFKVNVFSPIYTYQKYVEYLGGKQGQMAITVSAIGKLAMPGYTLYSASKFAMQGFQQGLRYEMPKKRFAHLPVSDSHRHGLLQKSSGRAGRQSHPRASVPRAKAATRCKMYGQGLGT